MVAPVWSVGASTDGGQSWSVLLSVGDNRDLAFVVASRLCELGVNAAVVSSATADVHEVERALCGLVAPFVVRPLSAVL